MRGGRHRQEERWTSTGHFVLLCTQHSEKTPSLVVWPSGSFFCHGCHHRGQLEDDPRLQEKVARLSDSVLIGLTLEVATGTLDKSSLAGALSAGLVPLPSP